jgi:hypothetical protein
MELVYFRDDGPNPVLEPKKYKEWKDKSRTACEDSAPPGKSRAQVLVTAATYSGPIFAAACCEHDKCED